MKKKILFSLLIIMLLFVTGCEEKTYTDAEAFKEEYEALNSNDDYHDIDISDNNPIVYANYQDVMDTLDDTGVILFGFPECQWCRNAIPVLLSVASDLEVEEIMYFNALNIRDTKTLDEEGNIVVEKEGTEEYYALVEKLGEDLSVYAGLNDETIKRIYFPTVVFVKDGEIIDIHVSTVASHASKDEKLTQEQTEELYTIYLDSMQEVFDIACATDEEQGC